MAMATQTATASNPSFDRTRDVFNQGARARPGAQLAFALLCQLPKSFTGLAADELTDAGVGIVVEPLGGAVVEDLRLAGLEPRERIEHDDAVGDLLYGLHVVR